MTSCACCNRPFREEWAEEHNRCPLCIAKNCTAHGSNCGIPEPNQNPEESRDLEGLPDSDEVELDDISEAEWENFETPEV
jgi:hypothetical protein